MPTIYYFQGAPITAPVSVETDELVFVNQALSLKTDRLTGASQRWLVSFRLAPTGSFEPLAALLTGVRQPITFNFPQFTRNLTSKTASTTATAAVSTSTITAASSVISELTVGRMIKFANHSKLYMVIGKPTSTTFTVYPSLQLAVPSTTSFVYGSNVPISVYIVSEQVRGITFSDGILEDLGVLKFEEAI